MYLLWTIDAEVVTRGATTKIPHLLDNFALPGLDLPCQGQILFNDKRELSFGLRFTAASKLDNTPLSLALSFGISTDTKDKWYFQVCPPVSISGNTHAGSPWQLVDKLPASKQYKLGLGIDYPTNFLKLHAAELLPSNLGNLYRLQIGCDIDIRCKTGSLIKAHRFIIMARCPPYRNHTFGSSKMPAGGQLLDWSQYSREAVEFVLQYLYEAKHIPAGLSMEERMEVILLANELQLSALTMLQATSVYHESVAVPTAVIAPVADILHHSDPHALSTAGQAAQLLKRALVHNI